MAEVKDNPVINHIAAAAQAQAANQTARLGVMQALDAQDEASNAAQVAQIAMGGASATMSAQQNSWKAATDATVAATREEFGSDVTKQGSESNYWLREMRDNSHKVYASLDVIHSKQKATLMDDPIGFINAQFTLPSDIATHNYYAEKYNIAEAALNEVTQASDASVRATKNAEKTTSTEFAIAEGEKAAQGAAYNVALLKAQAAGTRQKGVLELASLSRDDSSIAFQLHQANNSDASLAMQRAAHADMMEARKQRMEAAAELIDNKKAQAADLTAMREAYNAGAKRTGRAQFGDDTTFRRVLQSSAKNEDFMNTLGAGQEIMAQGGTTSGVPVASTAGHAAVMYLGASGGTKSDVGQFLVGVADKVKLDPVASKDRSAFTAAVTAVAGLDATAQLKKSTGIYAAPPLSVMLKDKASSGGLFIDSTLKPLLDANPNATIEDGVVLGKAYDFAKSSPANLNAAAADIAAYYKQVVIRNNLTKEYRENGLPAQVSYPTVVGGRNVDLTSEADIKRAIMTHNFEAARRALH